MDSINKTYKAFNKLKEFKYLIVLSAGRDKPIEKIILDFNDEDLFHILGLQHLSDIDLPKNKKMIASFIEMNRITDEYLSKSEYYDNKSLDYNIKNRIEKAGCLEEFLDSDDFRVCVYKLQHLNNTFINADYLIICKKNKNDEEYYIFVRKRKESDAFGIVSCFPKKNISYWGGKRYLLYKSKCKKDISCILFKHSNYVL